MESSIIGNHFLSACPHCDFLFDATDASKLWDAVEQHFELNERCAKANDKLPTMESLHGLLKDDKPALGERSEPPTAVLGEAASTEKSEDVCLKKRDAEHFAELLDEMIPDLINDRPKWLYHIGGMKTLRDQLRGVKTESGLA